MSMFLKIVAVLGILIIIYSFIEYRWFRTIYLKPTDFKSSQTLPDSLKGKRVVFISDLQYDHRFRRFLHGSARSLQKKINRLNPDLVILGGDIIHSKSKGNKDIFPYLKGIDAPKVAVLGNHDYRDYNTVILGLKSAGCTLLINDTMDFHGLKIVGIDDYRKGSPRYPQHDPAYSLLVTHNPDYFKAIQRPHQSDMALAGHLHGGQITVFGKYAPISNSEFGKELIYGMKQTNQGNIYVSSGVGGSVAIFPIRFFARPEIVVIDFEA